MEVSGDCQLCGYILQNILFYVQQNLLQWSVKGSDIKFQKGNYSTFILSQKA